MNPSATNLTLVGRWDEAWAGVRLPLEHYRQPHALLLNDILDVLDRYLPRGKATVLKVGGAPGPYLAYIHKTHGHEVHCLDYSPVGCEVTRRNFAALGIPGFVHEMDLMDPTSRLGPFDVAYSLGVIEHFADLPQVVARHLAFVKPGGLLALGCPNFRGVNEWFMRRMAPKLLAEHNLDTMTLGRWCEFEQQHGLQPLFKGYLGGFDPELLKRCEVVNTTNGALYFGLQVLGVIRRWRTRLGLPRLGNAPWFSAYLMGVYRVSDAAPSAGPGRSAALRL